MNLSSEISTFSNISGWGYLYFENNTREIVINAGIPRIRKQILYVDMSLSAFFTYPIIKSITGPRKAPN